MQRWEEREVELLQEVYATSTNHELRNMFPNRTLQAIEKKARKFGMYKTPSICFANRSSARKKVADKKKRPAISTAKGYMLVYFPTHKRADKRGYVQEHILVFEKETGIEVPKSCCVHHLNGNKKDNRISNLCLMTQGGHTTYHHSGRCASNETKEKISAKAKERFKIFSNHPSYKNIDKSEFENMVNRHESVGAICKKFGICKSTYYAKKKEFGIC